jgi:hypothetical protein
MLANQLLALIIGGLASVGIYHLVRRIVAGGAPLGRSRATGAEEDRLLRIEQAIEAVTLEMERVSEAQRFTTRLLMERLPERQAEPLPPQQRLPGRTPGTTTPH